MTKLNGCKRVAVLLLLGTLAIAAPGQVFTTLASFDGTVGGDPGASLTQGLDGNLYGTAQDYGAYGGLYTGGAVFEASTSGSITALYSFCSECGGGSVPQAPLTELLNGYFISTTLAGGNHGNGTVFRITENGALTTLHAFDGNDGCAPKSAPIEASDGSFYGTTTCGDAGTIYKLEAGTLTTLYTFSGNDGRYPYAGLIQASDGNFYGTTILGGVFTDCVGGCGTVFKITPGGTLTVLHSFDGADGSLPYGALVQASDGNFYGTTEQGGGQPAFECTTNTGCGTVFRITPQGEFKTIDVFCSQFGCDYGHAGLFPLTGLIQATDGNLYGTTAGGGQSRNCNDGGCGTLFQITPNGTLTTLYSFCSQYPCPDGENPNGLTQGTDGKLYATTAGGGNDICLCGTFFSLDMGLGPFVTFVRPFGEVGQTGPILGQGFTGATAVSLNGTSTSFTVVSDTLIKATVPSGATTGYVTVTTPTGVLTSNVPFQVIP